MTNFDDLPVEVILEIAKNLSAEDAMRLASTSRRLRGIILNDAELWEHFTQRDLGIKIAHAGDANKARNYYRFVLLKKRIDTLMPFLKRNELKFIKDLQDYPADALKSLKAFSQSSHIEQTIDESTLKKVNEHLNEIIGFLAKPTTCDTEQCTPLHSAAFYGHLDVVNALLAHPGIDINKADREGYAPLYWATIERHLDVVKALLACPGIDVNKAESHGQTPLYRAARYGHLDIVTALLACPGIDVNKADWYKKTPLSLAAYVGHLDIVTALLACPGIDVNKADCHGQTPLYRAAIDERSLDVVKALLACPGIDVNKAESRGQTPLSYAKENNLQSIVKLIEAHIKSQEEAKASAKVVSQLVMHYFAQKPVAEVNDNQDAQKEGMKERLYGQYGNHK